MQLVQMITGNVLLKSRDGGIDWEEIDLPAGIYPLCMDSMGKEQIVTIARNKKDGLIYLYKSSNAGQTWEEEHCPDMDMYDQFYMS